MSKPRSSSKNVLKLSCLCKRGSCSVCGLSCRQCGCSCDGDDPVEALRRKPGVHKKKPPSNENTAASEQEVPNEQISTTILHRNVNLSHGTNKEDINTTSRLNLCTEIIEDKRIARPEQKKQQLVIHTKPTRNDSDDDSYNPNNSTYCPTEPTIYTLVTNIPSNEAFH